MKRTKLYIVSLMMIALAGCQKEEMGAVQHPDAVELNVAIGKQPTTRVDPTDKNATSFALNDQIAISNGAEFVTYTQQSSGWQSEADKYLKWSSASMNFKAYYPINASTSMTGFALPTDQSSQAKLTTADYMTAQGTQPRPESGSKLDLTFARHTAQIVVRIAGFSSEFVGTPTISNLRIYSPRNGYFNGTATGATSTAVTPYIYSENYYALVVPVQGQSTAGNFITLTVTDSRGSKQLTVSEIPAMVTGKHYTYNLTIGKEQVIVTNVTVQDWGNSETIPDGEAVLVKRLAGATFEFIYVKGGATFSMGSPSSETERFDDELQHWAKLSEDYFISRSEITQSQWKAIMTATGVQSPGFAGDDRPMENISWDDICTGSNSFLAAINSLSAGVFDLPTEAQWEYAARGGVRANGYMKYAGTNQESQLGNYAWHKTNANSTQAIAGKQANSLGIYDMTGNVWEWCKDSWDESENYPTSTTKERPAIDPVVNEGKQRVLRGGGWNTAASNARSAARFFYHPHGKNNATGFRLVMRMQ